MTEEAFSGKVAWITGGAQGFGAGVARRLAGFGAKIVVSDINAQSGEAVAADVGGTFVACDVSELDDCKAAVDAVVKEHGRIDIAFLNAGISTGCLVGDDFDLALYRRAMGVNLDGVVFGAHTVFAAMKASGGGDIVATASLAGLLGVAFDPIYGANKHAVVGLVRALGDDWTQHGIRVNGLCPGFADTAIVDPLRDVLADGGISLIPPEMVVDAFVSAATSGRSGECWVVQPGRPGEPFRFRGVPGPREIDDDPAE